MIDLAKSKKSATASSKRGRPPLSQDEAITAKIVRTALRCFLTNGYGATSMKRIIDDSGISSGTLYARFPNKQAVFEVAVSYQVDEWKNLGPSKLAQSRKDSLYEVIYIAALEQMETWDKPEVKGFAKLLQEADKFPELANIYGREALRTRLDLIIDSILRSPEGEKLARKEAEELAQTVMETVSGWTQMNIFKTHNNSPERERKKAAIRIAKLLSRSKS